jgi:hypothetical protein
MIGVVHIEPHAIKDILVGTLTAAAADVPINSRKFFISNTGAQPLYFKEKNGVDASATNAMLVPANSVFPAALTASTLSVVSNATGTTYAILTVDIY